MLDSQATTRMLGLLAAWGILFGGCAPRGTWNMQPDGRMNYSAITESSGIVVSRQFPKVYWTHNDAHNSATLFAVDPKGRLIREYEISGAFNRDWEDIALDSQNRLFLFDNTSRDDPQGRNSLYFFDEPDPFRDSQVRNLRQTYLLYPEGEGPFDCEAMFIAGERVYLVTKPWDGSLPRVYRSHDLEQGGRMEFVGQVPVHAMITGGDISVDGRRLALSSYRALIIFEGQGPPEQLLQQLPLICELNARQVEGIAWMGDRLVITNEQREIFKVSSSRWRHQDAPFLRPPEESVPFVARRPSVHIPLDKWPQGRWLQVRLGQGEENLGRLIWSKEGLHIGLELPRDVSLRPIDLKLAKDFDEWFQPGMLYVLLNPDGARPLSYGENDRCLVVTRNAIGEPSAKSLYLRPATWIESLEETPGWVQIQESGSRLLITIKTDAPGFGLLDPNRKVGFNLLLIRGNGQLVSWAPLTRPFSWDQPNVWGLLELRN